MATLTEEILNEKLHFLYSVNENISISIVIFIADDEDATAVMMTSFWYLNS